LKRLDDLKRHLEHEIDLRRQEIDEVQNKSLGMMELMKRVVARQISRHSDDIESAVGAVYAQNKTRQFKDATEYIDYLKHSIDEIYRAISAVNDSRANIEKHMRTIQSEADAMTAWLRKADELFK
jgi:methyl-accepting chemotaxis protein